MEKTFPRSPRLLMLGLVLLLTGCYKHTRIVQQVGTPDVVKSASAAELVETLNANFAALHTLSTSVTITASTGGGHAGKVTTYTSFKGYIQVRKPRDLRVILEVPVIGGIAMEMVSDDRNFKLIIPSENKAMVGADEVTTPSKKTLENLRPHIFLDAFLIQGVSPTDYLSLTQSNRLLTTDVRKHQATEEPDYDLAVLHPEAGNILKMARVLHYSRVTLLPFQQDIYDDNGRIVTTVVYDNYQKFGDLEFPMSIDIRRPLDEYELKIAVTKLAANKTLDNDSFHLEIPAGLTIQHLD